MAQSTDKEKVKRYYDQETEDYIKMYKEGYQEYPSNLIRINFVLKRLKENKSKTVFDVGCGACAPMIRLLNEGMGVKGFDFSDEMVKTGQRELEKAGYDPGLIFKADLEDDRTLPDEKFDAVIALGVFPHLKDEAQALSNLGKRLNKGGLVFISFRNDLFAAYTLNRYSLNFFLNSVVDMTSLPKDLSQVVVDFYSKILKADKPEIREDGRIYYTDIYAKFRNPLSIERELFEPDGFSIVKLHFYHYHALPPLFEEKNPDLFRELSLRMEDPSSWKGYLMASAFVVEARKRD